MSSEIITEIESCRVCGRKYLTPILSFGELYVSDFVDSEESMESKQKFPLEVVLCNKKEGGCGLLQLKHAVSPKVLYRNYWYRSGVNKTMGEELTGIVRRAESIVPLREDDFVLDIGSNDNTLLRFYKNPKPQLVGFEPAKNIVEKYGGHKGIQVITEFFNFDDWEKRFGDAKAKVITAIAMFYDLSDPNSFVADIIKCLDPEGIFIIQMSYLPSILTRNAFDGFCHEHLEFYSLGSLEYLLNKHDLEVFDVELRDINEGSFRVFIKHKNRGSSLKIDPHAVKRIVDMRNSELSLGLYDKKVYEDFVLRVNAIRDKVCSFIKSESSSGKMVYVYGASTKGNTLLQYFGLDNSLILAAAERNPDKWGKKTVGTNIPIISEDEARTHNPHYFLILPWHFLDEFKEREAGYLKKGGKFIVPLPEFRII